MKYYKPSGRFSPAGLIKALLIGGVGTMVSAIVYAYAIAWVPFIYISILFVIGFGMVAGGLTSAGLTAGKVRNTPLAMLVGLVVGVLGLYAAWVAWILAESSQEVFVANPIQLFALIQALAVEGVWSFKDITPTGWGLYSFWLTEAAIILGASVYGGYQAVADNPFCEKCECWMDDAETLGTFENPADLRKLTSDLECGSKDGFKQLNAIPQFSAAHTVALREKCPECQSFQLLSLKTREMTENKDGEKEVKEKDLLKRLVIEPDFGEALSSHWKAGIKSLEEATSAQEVE